ncbi:MAG: hypothetical protein IJZ74_07255 [Clostridia bacterium]|nr:hypothetical protein [Clostridia bacterium]
MRDLVFLPDREGRDELTATTGFVRLGADASALSALADRLVVRGEAAAHADETTWRGMLAVALLADAWPDAGAAVSVLTVDGTTSLFASWVLAAKQRDAVHLTLLERDGQRKLLGIADEQTGLILPAAPGDLREVMPERVLWYDRQTGAMTDPTPFLSEGERQLLCSRIVRLNLQSASAADFVRDLQQAGAEEIKAVRMQDAEALARLSARIQAVHGLAEFEAFSVKDERCAPGGNALMKCLCGQEAPDETEAAENRTYLWNGVPFARTDSRIGLTGSWDAAQEAALEQIAQETAMMAAQSAAWNRRTAKSIAAWLDTSQAAGLLPEARECIDEIRQRTSDAGRQVQMTVTLTWPWDAGSGAVRALLRETLGDGWMRGAANPFSDRLTKLTGHLLGDTALQINCACADGVLLPPLSRDMAVCVAAAADGEGLALDAMRFQPQEDGGITASFLLRGMGEVRMVRSYSVDEIAVLTQEESPSVAVWPCLPLERWHAYHVFAKPGTVRVEALRGGEWTACPVLEERWSCLRTESYPACLIVMQDDLCLGALPNALPSCHVEAVRDAVAAIDLGAATTVSVLAFDGSAAAAEGQELTRLLVRPQEMSEDDFLLSLTPRSVMPTAVELTGPGDELFVDGHVLCAASFDALSCKEAASIKSSLKWRADAASVRARRLLMHQAMLGTALNAMLEGARSILWRVTVADEMGDEGRLATTDMMEELASAVAMETGLPLTEGQPAVTWAEEAPALCAYLRGEGGVRGSFAVLDMGSGSTKLHLWMQGQSRPAAGSVLLDGTQTMLLAALRDRPEMLEYDFADCADPAVIAAAQTLSEQLQRAGESLAEADKAQLMLHAMLDEYRQPITSHISARASLQRPTFLQAVLLENQAAAMFIAGLMLEQVGSDSMQNHKLPEDMTICLTGRGAWLLDSLMPAARNALQQITRRVMRLDNLVRFVTLKAAPQPSLSVALGMAVSRDTQRAVNAPEIRTRTSFSQLMRDLMLQLVAHFPTHTWLLHEGLFDAWGNLTPAGEDTIRRVASMCYGDGEDIPASVMAFVRQLRATPVAPDHAAFPEA